MSDEFGNLAQIAAAALVSAMVTDSWEAVKGRFAVVARRDRQLDATHRELTARSGSALEQAKSAQTRAWTDILQDILDDDPGKAQALHDFLGYLRVSPQAAPGPSLSVPPAGASVSAGTILAISPLMAAE